MFVYITSTQDEKSYSLRGRDNVKEYTEDLDIMKTVGDKLIISFNIPIHLAHPTIGLCEQFINGKLSLKDLEAGVKSL